MYAKYGSYTHALSEGEVTFDVSRRWNDGGQHVARVVTAHIRGLLQAADSSSLITAMAALETAYRRQGQNFLLLLSDGSTVHQAMYNAGSLGGVRVIHGPSYPSGHGYEGGTFRTYEITLEAEYPDAASFGMLLAFTETVQFMGGGPRVVWREATTGLPQKQITAQATTYKAVQAGSAIGYRTRPTPPAPIWPQYLKEQPNLPDMKSPRRSGPPGAPMFSEFEVSWHYTFEADVRLAGEPHRWPG